MTNKEITKFFEECKKFDWFYDFSDDHRVWQNGDKNKRRLEAEAKSPILKSIFKDFHDHYFSGKEWNTEKKPLPKLEDYLIEGF